MRPVSLTPTEVFYLFELVRHKASTTSPTTSGEIGVLLSKLRDSVLDSLQELQDEAAAAGFERWQKDTINKIQDLNETMRNMNNEDASYRGLRSKLKYNRK